MQRRSIAVRGIVQGVGFRPFVYGLASRFSLTGFVRNDPLGVLIEVEGQVAELERFEAELVGSPPSHSTIDGYVTAALPVRGDAGFRIEVSDSGAGHARVDVRVSPDLATCDACLAELFDPSNRRFQYPFITCTACGPRLTIVTGVPYDRQRTTMAVFPMCEACQREYDNPGDRRFHAEPIACAACGPRVRLLDRDGAPMPGEPFARLTAALRGGGIAAVKGLGGYHLACDATNETVVSELRRRKHRDEKPFAVMFESTEAAAAACRIDTAERELLAASSRPIVLLPRRASPGPLAPAEGVAPGCPNLGVMLPSTPLHHLLMREMGRPLVMTSGNRSHEPIAYQDADALTRLAPIADVFLTHDREIRVRCDDGVTRAARGRELPVRRSRGQAPRPVRLPFPCAEPVLAVGGQLKNTFALGRGRDGFVSHHIGDLDELSAYRAFCRDIDLYERLLAIEPRVIVHDLHPGYGSTRYAVERAAAAGLTTMAVQHHHAHVASCMAEHGLSEPVIGVAFDGTGYGEDGTVWGGEFLVGDARSVHRAAHLRPVALPGGDQAVREPWRMALAHLLDAGLSPAAIEQRVGKDCVRTVMRMIERGVNTPRTSSAGRLFDAIAAIAGVRDHVSFEGQAAMQLEWLAGEVDADRGYPHHLEPEGDRLTIDTRPIITEACRDAGLGRSPATIARRFHVALADVVESVCVRLRERTGIGAVVLSGGVFLNVILTLDCEARLSRAGFRVFGHRMVPPGDGGVSLGQLAVAAGGITRS
ncbi:MAG: carbamoyltransferase HypF [Acidobacteria bacterium]|nr:carbamoyltransferase HypF [Acidobacteriota bacterium]